MERIVRCLDNEVIGWGGTVRVTPRRCGQHKQSNGSGPRLDDLFVTGDVSAT
jgi:hypothetical protein